MTAKQQTKTAAALIIWSALILPTLAQAAALNVQSTPVSGVAVTVAPPDTGGLGDGATPFSRTYTTGTDVTLTAPAMAGGKCFTRWTNDGNEVSTTTQVTVSADAAHTLTAVYSTDVHLLTVQTSEEPVHALMRMTPPDALGQDDRETPFTWTYCDATFAYVSAPVVLNGKRFLKWTLDGTDSSPHTSTRVEMNANHTLVAVYTQPSMVLTASDDVTVSAYPALVARDEYQAPYPHESANPPCPNCRYGLFSADGDGGAHGFVEFTLGTEPVTSARLKLYNYWAEDLCGTNPGVGDTSLIARAKVIGFNENDQSAGAISITGTTWAQLPLGPIYGANEVGQYAVNITDFYNANLGATVAFCLVETGANPDDGPIFEDRELSAYTNGVATADANGYPAIDVDMSGSPCDMQVTPNNPQTISAFYGQPAVPAGITYTIRNPATSGSSIDFTAAETDSTGANVTDYAWFSLSKSSGSVEPLATDQLIVSFNTSRPLGTHTGYVRIQNSCSPADTLVYALTLTINGSLEVTPAAEVYRSYVAGSGAAYPTVEFKLKNTTAGDVPYSVSRNCSWLTPNMGSGSVPAAGTETITCTLDPTGLASGLQMCQLTITETGSGLQYDRQLVLSVLNNSTAREQFNAEFTAWSGQDDTAHSPWDNAGDPFRVPVLDFSIYEVPAPVQGQPNPGWLTQGAIDGVPTTAKFLNTRAKPRFKGSYPLGSTYNPGQGLVAAWRCRLGANIYKRGPIQVSLPAVPGPYTETVAGNSVLIAPNTQNNVTTLNLWTGGSAQWEGINPLVLSKPLSGDEYHQWTLSGCRGLTSVSDRGIGTLAGSRLTDGSKSWAPDQWMGRTCLIQGVGYAIAGNTDDELTLTGAPPSGSRRYEIGSTPYWAYWNLWLDGEKFMFTGFNGSVSGPGGLTYSFRTGGGSQGSGGVTDHPHVLLYENLFNTMDFEWDWVRIASLRVDHSPFWDGEGILARPLCNSPWADADADHDIDIDDFGAYQACFTGSAPLAVDPDVYCGCFDLAADGSINKLDFEKFMLCATGPSIPWAPSIHCPR